MTDVRADLWLAQRICRDSGLSWTQVASRVTGGATTPEERRERLGRLITELGLSGRTLGYRDGKPESYREYWRRRHGRTLDAAPSDAAPDAAGFDYSGGLFGRAHAGAP